jgi:hypothetical protein
MNPWVPTPSLQKRKEEKKEGREQERVMIYR